MIDSYRTTKQSASARITRKKSRFLSTLLPVASEEDVEATLAQMRKTYHDASHYCYAFRMLDSTNSEAIERSEDDGEPSGSAGMPILHSLQGADLLNVLCVVVRYFGGTKLGVGGLIRAYGDAADEALTASQIVRKKLTLDITIRFPGEVHSGVMSTIHRFDATIRGMSYEGTPHVRISLPPSQVEPFRSALTEATGARAQLAVIV